MVNFPVSKVRPKVYKPDSSGVCIYCGKHEPTGLKREHIIPIGLGGGLILLEASCSECQKITSNFETACLKKAFFSFRFHFGLIRHKREIPKKVPLYLLSDHIHTTAEIPYITPEENPNFLLLPLIHYPPGMISHRPPGISSPFTLQVFGNDETLRKRLHKQGQIKYVERLFNMLAFSRMLAKIAHSFAVAEFGLNGFAPELTEFILRGFPEVASFYVGDGSSIHSELANNKILHQVGWCPIRWGHQWQAAIRIRLFASSGPTPIYMVMAGALSREQQSHHGLPELNPDQGQAF